MMLFLICVVSVNAEVLTASEVPSDGQTSATVCLLPMSFTLKLKFETEYHHTYIILESLRE